MPLTGMLFNPHYLVVDITSQCLIGNAEAPNIIVQATFSAHLAACEIGGAPLDGTPFKRGL